MKPRINISLIICLFGTLSATAIDTVKVSSTIKEVTVFFNGAQVGREARVNLKKGKQLLLFKSLPREINEQSIQVGSINDVTILSVKHELDFSGENRKSKVVKDLETAIEAEERKMKAVMNQKEVLAIEERMLIDNSRLGNENGTSVAQIREGAEYYRERLNNIRTEQQRLEVLLDKIKDDKTELYAKLNKITAEDKKAYSKILVEVESAKEMTGNMSLKYYISSAGWTPLYDFRVSDVSKPLSIVYNANVYQSSGEDWKNVNIKLSTNDPALSNKKPEIITWYLDQPNPYDQRNKTKKGPAAIRGRVFDQENGEVLPFVNVEIHKGQELVAGVVTDFDGQFAVKPLEPGYYNIKASYVGYKAVQVNGLLLRTNEESFVDVVMQGEAVTLEEVVVTNYSESGKQKRTISREEMQSLPTRNVASAQSMVPGAVGGNRSEYDPYTEAERKRDQQVVNYISNSLKSTVTNLEYSIDVPYTVLSDGQDYHLKIKQLIKACEYVYYALPKLDAEAFLTAQVADWSSLNLISGKASIFFKGTFIGETDLDAFQTEDTLELSLGRDRNLVIKREGNKQKNDKKKSGNYIKEVIAWDISLRNNSGAKMKVIIEDQYPKSQLSSIEVELLESPEAKVNAKTGQLTWKLELEPSAQKEVSFSYEVKYYKNLNVRIE